MPNYYLFFLTIAILFVNGPGKTRINPFLTYEKCLQGHSGTEASHASEEKEILGCCKQRAKFAMLIHSFPEVWVSLGQLIFRVQPRMKQLTAENGDKL